MPRWWQKDSHMALSATHRFLVEANRLAGPDFYFRGQAVAAALGYSEEETEMAMRSLDHRKLLIRLTDGQARLRASGRTLARMLEARAAADA